jgi:ABC-2 type transport system ATP-binding protein
MKPENAIEVKNVTKKFKVYMDKGYTLKELTLFSKRRKYEERTVLNGISFEVKKGEAIGLIGHNGCGKSTTLKLLTRIIYPDSGTIEMRGRVSSLLELGAGFHPDMSGRQNIYTNASIFGLTKKEIEARIEQIIAFSELEEFIDNPVRTYSSGMYMRLAFAVAINVNADILLIDEILAVGDANFQAKCFSKLQEIKAAGTTIVIVSHSLGQIEQICERSIWIHEGQIRAEGSPRIVHPEYLSYMGQLRQNTLEKEAERAAQEAAAQEAAEAAETEMQNSEESAQPETAGQPDTQAGEAPAGETLQAPAGQPEGETSQAPAGQPEGETSQAPAEQPASEEAPSEQPQVQPEPEQKNKKRWGNGAARITGIRSCDKDHNYKIVFNTEEPIEFEISYKVKKKVKDAVVGIALYRVDGLHCYGTNTRIDQMDKYDLEQDGTVRLSFEKAGLLPGEYEIDFAIESGNGIAVDYYTKAYRIYVYSEISDVGVARMEHKWRFE